MIRFKESYAIFQTTLVFLKSRKKFNLTNDFLSTVRKVVKDLPSDKVSASEIPIKIVKESTTFSKLTNCMNESLTNNTFPDTKLSDITAVFKKFDPSDKAN